MTKNDNNKAFHRNQTQIKNYHLIFLVNLFCTNILNTLYLLVFIQYNHNTDREYFFSSLTNV